MTEHIILDNDYITLGYIDDGGLLYHVVHQPVGGQTLRDMLTAGLEAMQAYGICKWLADDRKNGPMSSEDAEWGSENVTTRAPEVGWKYWALVVPEELVAAGSMTPIIEANWQLGKLRMQVFSSVDEARAWLDHFEC